MSLMWDDLCYFAPFISLFPTIATSFKPPMSFVKAMTIRDFPGGPVAKTLCFQCRRQGLSPGQGIRCCMLQQRVFMLQLKNLRATIENPTCHN